MMLIFVIVGASLFIGLIALVVYVRKSNSNSKSLAGKDHQDLEHPADDTATALGLPAIVAEIDTGLDENEAPLVQPQQQPVQRLSYVDLLLLGEQSEARDSEAFVPSDRIMALYIDAKRTTL